MALALSHSFATPRPLHAAVALALLAGCTAGGLGPDAAERANIYPANIVPRSSPSALVMAFDRHCVNAGPTLAAQDGDLRAAGYVPAVDTPRNGARLYVVDDRRPAVAISARMCLVQAMARTGQTERAHAYVAETFPEAKPIGTADLGRHVEQAWAIPGGILATERRMDASNRSRYSIILFRPGTAGA
ncbi:MAG: hypothetical protein K8F59_01105 [Rhodobacteraceae bacterium]|nr:hypothetical protein [Paracoccaceae bacterium]